MFKWNGVYSKQTDGDLIYNFTCLSASSKHVRCWIIHY